MNGIEYADNYGTESITIRNLNENDQVVITTKEIVRDNTATIWVDDTNAAQYEYQVYRYSDHASVNLISGEEVTVNFNDEDNPYYFAFYVPTCCVIYQNGFKIEPQYEGSTSYYITLEDGDKIRVYLASEPEESMVTFEMNDFSGDNVTVIVDGKDYANWEAGFTVLKGTKISVTGAQVIVNDVTVDGVGTYTFTADEAEIKVVLSDLATGVENVKAESTVEDVVYDLMGRKVENPAQGIYVKNGKKFIVR